MDNTAFIQLLQKGSQKLKHRELLVNACFEHSSRVDILLENIRRFDDENSNFSARIFELACKRDLKIIIPYLDVFFEMLDKLQFDGVTRAYAKIGELLMIEYHIKNNALFISLLKEHHFEQLIEASFDWMITDRAIAIQAHSMYSLYSLGTKYDWVHTELIQVIEKRLPHGSTGYKNRGRKIIKAIKTKKRFKL